MKRRTLWLSSLVVAAGLFVLAQDPHGGAPAAAGASGSGSTVAATRGAADGIFTARQAERGKPLYEANCAACHGANLLGVSAPPLAGNTFKAKWAASTVGDLYAYTQATMPLGRGNSLSAQVYADIVAYMLQANGYPAGRSLLPPDAKALSDFAFDKAAQNAAAKAAQAAQTPSQAPVVTTQANPSGPRTAADGVFTNAQADRGRVIFTNPTNACAGCHGAELGGSPGGPGLVRGAFKSRWGGKNVGELMDYIRKFMPPGRTGIISDQASTDMVAFILRANNFPAGTAELPTALEELNKITIPQ